MHRQYGITKHLVVLVGFPGSGKSTLCKEQYGDYERISQDEQGKDGHKKAFKFALETRCDIIIDRCGFNVEQRQRYIKQAKEIGYKTTIVWLTTSADECIRRIKQREGHPNLDNTTNSHKIEEVVKFFERDFVAPKEWEADEIIKL